MMKIEILSEDLKDILYYYGEEVRKNVLLEKENNELHASLREQAIKITELQNQLQSLEKKNV